MNVSLFRKHVSGKSKIFALLELFRPELPFAAGCCVLLAQVLALDGFPAPVTGLLGFCSAFLLSASALIFNDYFDFNIDLVNAPQRPIPSKRVSPGEAIGLGIGATMVGLTLSAALGITVLLFAIPVWFIGFLYNWRYKRSGLPGNLLVSISVASLFVYGGFTVGDPLNPLLLFFGMATGLLDLAEEIAGDVLDVEGDRREGVKSLAVTQGVLFAQHVATLLWIFLIIFSWLPLISGRISSEYLPPLIILNLSLVIGTLGFSLASGEKRRPYLRVNYIGPLLAVIVLLLQRYLGTGS